jgi:hypothetical protein
MKTRLFETILQNDQPFKSSRHISAFFSKKQILFILPHLKPPCKLIKGSHLDKENKILILKKKLRKNRSGSDLRNDILFTSLC